MIDKSIANEVRRRNLTYLAPEKIDSLYECIKQIQDSQVPGDIAEFGVALGGSGICLATSLTVTQRYFGFDVFGMIPPPSAADGEDVNIRYEIIASGKSQGLGGEKYYGYVDNLMEVVRNNFKSFGCQVDNEKITLVKGLYQDTLPLRPDISIAMAHIDCDWYEAVSYCLNYVWPRLSSGGFVILDDYNDWSGCKKATDEFMKSQRTAKLVRDYPHAVLQKLSEEI